VESPHSAGVGFSIPRLLSEVAGPIQKYGVWSGPWPPYSKLGVIVCVAATIDTEAAAVVEIASVFGLDIHDHRAVRRPKLRRQELRLSNQAGRQLPCREIDRKRRPPPGRAMPLMRNWQVAVFRYARANFVPLSGILRHAPELAAIPCPARSWCPCGSASIGLVTEFVSACTNRGEDIAARVHPAVAVFDASTCAFGRRWGRPGFPPAAPGFITGRPWGRPRR